MSMRRIAGWASLAAVLAALGAGLAVWLPPDAPMGAAWPIRTRRNHA
jgi:hypothetical protein